MFWIQFWICLFSNKHCFCCACSLGEQSHQGPRLGLWDLQLCPSTNDMCFFEHIRHLKLIIYCVIYCPGSWFAPIFQACKESDPLQFRELSSKHYEANATAIGRTYATRLVLVVLCLEERAACVGAYAHWLKLYYCDLLCLMFFIPVLQSNHWWPVLSLEDACPYCWGK